MTITALAFDDDFDDWLPTTAAAAFIGITTRELYRRINDGEIEARRFGRVIRVPRDEVHRHRVDAVRPPLVGNSRPAEDSRPVEVPGPPVQPMPARHDPDWLTRLREATEQDPQAPFQMVRRADLQMLLRDRYFLVSQANQSTLETLADRHQHDDD